MCGSETWRSVHAPEFSFSAIESINLTYHDSLSCLGNIFFGSQKIIVFINCEIRKHNGKSIFNKLIGYISLSFRKCFS